MVYFVDRTGHEENLLFSRGERFVDVIHRERLPLASIIISDQFGNIYPETCLIEPSRDFYIRLIEGYDISSILKFSKEPETDDIDSIYLKRRLLFSPQGGFQKEESFLNADRFISYIEEIFIETIEKYEVINSGDKVVMGLSGGVDSSSLLILLSVLRKKINFELFAVTFQDFDSYSSSTFENAQNLARNLSIEHCIVNENIIQNIFHLRIPLRLILPALMETEYAHFVMYIDHHTTRRALEYFAEKEDISKISLGLHCSDILAGLLNSFTSYYEIGDLPKRKVGLMEYIYPLMYITKKELYIYYYLKTKRHAQHSTPNLWEFNPSDRNFFYYLADMLQEIWPGIEYYIFEAHMRKKGNNDEVPEFMYCENCKAAILKVKKNSENLCDVCTILKKAGYVTSIS